MSYQTKGTTTNLTKLVAWDIDLYNSMSTDEDCLIWLSQQDKYLLKNSLRQVKWQTRWTSEQGTAQPDRSLIAENMAYKLSQEYCVDICQLIIDCIEVNPSVRAAINDSIQGLPDTPGQSSQYEQSVFDSVPLCDKDTTWGYVDALWTYINAQNVDLLEQLNEATNSAGQITTLFKIIPGMEQLPIIDILEWVENLGEYNLDAYNASITTAIQDQIKCDLFCIAVDNNCHITFEQTWDYFVERFGGGSFPNLGATFTELVLFMITGIYLSDKIVFLWTLIQLGFAFIGTRFLNQTNVQAMAVQAQNGNPDNDWVLLCTACGWTYNSDFPTSQEGWVASMGNSPYDAPRAIWSIGNGWDYVDFQLNATQYARWDGIDYSLASTYVELVTLTYNMTKAVGQTGLSVAVLVQCELASGGAVLQKITFNDVQNGNGQTLQLSVNDNVVRIYVLAVSDISNIGLGDLSGSAKVVSVTVNGTGINPF